MFWSLVKKELLASVLTVRFIVALLVCGILMPISVLVLSNDFARESEDYNSRVTLEQRRDEAKGTLIKVNRPVPPLSPLFRGVVPESATAVSLRYFLGWNYPVATNTQSITHDIFPTVDLSFIIGVVLSALALLFSFDAISGEKADATLPLLMSFHVPRFKLVLGKWFGLTLAALTPFVAGLIISLMIFLFITGVALPGVEWFALIVALFVALLYLSLFVAIGLVVSTFTRHPSLSIIACLCMWGLCVIILPQAANALANEVQPIRSPQEIEKTLREMKNQFTHDVREHNRGIIERAKAKEITERELYQLRDQFETRRALEELTEAAQVEREYWLEIARQEQVGRYASMLSPYAALTEALIALADTGPAGQRAFLRQAYDHGETYFNYVQSEDGDVETAPPFVYQPRPLEARIDTALLPIAVLVVLHAVLLFVGVIRFNSYDVR